MEDSKTIQHFLDNLKFERRFSEHTTKCYGADLAQFGEFLLGASETSHLDTEPVSPAGRQGGAATAVATPVKPKVDELLLSAGTDAVRVYLVFLNKKQYSKATIARKLATLRSFYKFLVTRNQLTSNPVNVIDSFPISVCRFARARFSKLFRGIAAYGKELGNQTFYGFRLHVKINSLGMIQTFEMAPANVHDLRMLDELIPASPGTF